MLTLADRLRPLHRIARLVAIAGVFALAAGACEDGTSAARLPSTPFRALDSSGELRLARLDEPTVVNVWATWCVPCREELPTLDAAAGRYDGKVRIVGIDAGDDPADARAFLAELGVGFDQYLDPSGDARAALRVTGLPTTVLIEGGRIVARLSGRLDADRLDRAIRTEFDATD